MSEGTNSTNQQPQADTKASGQADGTAAGQDTGRTFTQDDLNRFLAKERRDTEARFAEHVAKAQQFDELAEKDKTDLQRAVDRGDQLEKDLAAERASRLRLEVAQAKRLPAELAARLQGTSKEELEADADALARLLPAQQAANSFRDAQGKPGGGAGASGDWQQAGLVAGRDRPRGDRGGERRPAGRRESRRRHLRSGRELSSTWPRRRP